MAKSALLPIERCGAKARGVGCIRAVVARIVIWPHQCRHLPVVPLCRRCIPQAGLSANKVAPCFFDAEWGAGSLTVGVVGQRASQCTQICTPVLDFALVYIDIKPFNGAGSTRRCPSRDPAPTRYLALSVT